MQSARVGIAVLGMVLMMCSCGKKPEDTGKPDSTKSTESAGDTETTENTETAENTDTTVDTDRINDTDSTAGTEDTKSTKSTKSAKNTKNTNVLAGMEMVEQYNFQGAVESFETALLNNEDKELAYRGLGIAYMGLGDYADAETAFLNSVRNAEGTATALVYDTNYYLASAYMKQGKYADAEKIYSAIIGLKKKEKDAYYLRACAILRQNRYDEAVLDFEKAFALGSDDVELVTDAFVEMQAAGYTEQGRKYLEEFMKKKEKSLDNGEKGVISYYLEDYENARIYLDSYVNEDDVQRLQILGQTYEKLGDMNYAAVVYQKYLESHEPNAAIYNSLGVCLMNQQKYDEALAVFESGVAMGASDYLQELKFNLIVANEYTGNFEQAKAMMQEYLQTYPDDAQAKRENEFLKTCHE
ncbi:MAG: tetratricopeptide repeat protein [Lachnospiraceae bacterium]|nr:tetratricopeptide repeat protein [Lachnospiraceae bacterium]